MKHYYPAYYHTFRCIAAACPDSCCQGWDVVIDGDTEDFYHSVEGDFGERLRASIYTDPDGDRVFHLAKEKKCPFWDTDKLCAIYKELGEEHLCLTCARFPRLSMDYGDFVEHSLALACPEAARLILMTDSAYDDFDEITELPDTEDAAILRFLRDARQAAAKILTADEPLDIRLQKLSRFSVDRQRMLTGEATGELTVYPAETFAQLEYINERSRERIVNAAKRQADLSQHETPLTRLALYYLYRYLLGAVDTLDIMSPIRFLITCINVIANLSDDGDLITAAQTYSKEVEQSYENMERLWYPFDGA